MNDDTSAIRTHRDVVSIRQAAEWSVRDLKGTYSRLKALLPTDSAKRQEIIEAAILLNNLRTSHLGLNQVRSVYEQHLHFDFDQFFGITS